MKCLIIYIVVLVFTASFACHHKQSPQQANADGIVNNNNGNTTNGTIPAVNDSLLFSSWYVKGCAESAAKGDTKFPPGDFPDLMYPLDNFIRSDGDSIEYNRYEEHLCCRQVRVTTQRQGNVINIIEYWFGRGCRCKCSSMVHAVIYDLPKGEYQLYAIATGTDPVDDNPTDGRDTVMVQKVFIH